MMWGRLWRALWLAGICCAAPALAATTALPTGKPAQPAAVAAAAPAPEAVTEWTQDALGRIDQARATLGSSGLYDQQSAAFDALAGRFDSQFERFVADPEDLSALSDVALDDASHELNVIARTLAGIDQSIGARAAAIETQLRGLTDISTHASELERDPASKILPQALRDRLERIVAETEPLVQSARKHLNKVAGLQNKSLTLNEHVTRLRQQVLSIRGERLRSLLRFQQPPLWRVTGSDVARSARHSGELALKTVSSSMDEFARNEAADIVLHVLLLCGLL